MKPAALALVFTATALCQTSSYVPGVTYQSDNPNYFTRNPFYFEGRIDWNLLKITTPSTAWEYAQRGIHNQEDLQDIPSAIADYQKAISMNSLANGTCQLITTAPAGFGQNTNPPPCMFTPRLRLAHLLKGDNPDVAVGLFREVLTIDPLRLGVNAFIAETYEIEAANAGDEVSRSAALQSAINSYKAELALSPITPATMGLTTDKANNAHVHWALATIYRTSGDVRTQAIELQAYLDATHWHSDTYPWRIPLASARLAKLRQEMPATPHRPSQNR